MRELSQVASKQPRYLILTAADLLSDLHDFLSCQVHVVETLGHVVQQSHFTYLETKHYFVL